MIGGDARVVYLTLDVVGEELARNVRQSLLEVGHGELLGGGHRIRVSGASRVEWSGRLRRRRAQSGRVPTYVYKDIYIYREI